MNSIADRFVTTSVSEATKAALDVLSMRYSQPQNEAVFLSGGMLSGFNHAFSDVDLYVITDDDCSALYPRNNLVVQLNQVPIGTFNQITDLYRQNMQITPSGFGKHMDGRKIASRLVTSLPLTTKAKSLPLPHSSAYMRLEIAARGAQVARMLEDAAGSVAFGDLLMAAQAAKNALESGIEASLAALGDLHFGEAILWRRVQACSTLASEFDALWSASTWPVRNDRVAVSEYVTKTCFIASRLASWAVVLSELNPQRTLPMRNILRDSVNPLGSPFHVLISGPRGLSIVGLDKAFRASVSAAMSWLLLESQPSQLAQFSRAKITAAAARATLLDRECSTAHLPCE